MDNDEIYYELANSIIPKIEIILNGNINDEGEHVDITLKDVYNDVKQLADKIR